MEQNESKEELARLMKAWRRLTWWQKKQVVLPLMLHRWSSRASARIETTLDLCATLPYIWLQNHIARRRARFAYYYPAHWL